MDRMVLSNATWSDAIKSVPGDWVAGEEWLVGETLIGRWLIKASDGHYERVDFQADDPNLDPGAPGIGDADPGREPLQRQELLAEDYLDCQWGSFDLRMEAVDEREANDLLAEIEDGERAWDEEFVDGTEELSDEH